MKFLCVFFAFSLFFITFVVNAQVINDPLADYYHRISVHDLYQENDDPSFKYSPQSEIFCFEADFTGSGRKSIFITDSGQSLNAHGKYGWAVYVPIASGGYQMVTDESTLIETGPNGPSYIGYIKEIKHYGAITGEKFEVDAYYFQNGAVQSKAIDQKREHANAEHYPKYFANINDHKVVTYTFAQLAKKYFNK